MIASVRNWERRNRTIDIERYRKEVLETALLFLHFMS